MDKRHVKCSGTWSPDWGRPSCVIVLNNFHLHYTVTYELCVLQPPRKGYWGHLHNAANYHRPPWINIRIAVCCFRGPETAKFHGSLDLYLPDPTSRLARLRWKFAHGHALVFPHKRFPEYLLSQEWTSNWHCTTRGLVNAGCIASPALQYIQRWRVWFTRL